MSSGGVLRSSPDISVVTDPAGSDRRRWWQQSTLLLVAVLAALNVADLVLTRLVLDRGGHEGNPVMRPLVEGMWSAALVKIGCLLLIAVLARRCLSSARVRLGLLLVVGWYVGVVAWNAAVLARA